MEPVFLKLFLNPKGFDILKLNKATSVIVLNNHKFIDFLMQHS